MKKSLAGAWSSLLGRGMGSLPNQGLSQGPSSLPGAISTTKTVPIPASIPDGLYCLTSLHYLVRVGPYCYWIQRSQPLVPTVRQIQATALRPQSLAWLSVLIEFQQEIELPAAKDEAPQRGLWVWFSPEVGVEVATVGEVLTYTRAAE
jgi:hypothetical protein